MFRKNKDFGVALQPVVMALTRLSKINVLNQGEKYAVHDVCEKVMKIMRACSYRQDACLLLWNEQLPYGVVIAVRCCSKF